MQRLSLSDSKKFSYIKNLFLDVDGVLTDGSLFYSKNGEEFKVFNVKDGLGIKMLMGHINVFVLTSNPSEIVKKRCEDLGVKNFYIGIKDKRQELIDIKTNFQILKESTVYIGDDLNDLSVRDEVQFFLSPLDAVSVIKKVSDFIIPVKGGKGVVRFFADVYLNQNNNLQINQGHW